MHRSVCCEGEKEVWVSVNKKEGAKASSFCVSKASPSGLRPQARVEAQPPEAALSAETEAVREAD